jgi:hypothetical protein
MNLQKRTPIRSKAIRNAAKDEACTVCGRNDGTTVFCHLNEAWAGKGMGQKADDIAGFFGCAKCHSAYDGRSRRNFVSTEQAMMAMYLTWVRLIDKGIITIKDSE